MAIRNQVKCAIAVIVMYLICCSNWKPIDVKGDTRATTQQTTYWIVIMWTLIGTRFMSEVCPLPVDDPESVAAAANGWGRRKGLMTVESNVHRFTSPADAERFRRVNQGLDLKLNAIELTKYLCIGQTLPPPKDYWVVIMHNNENDFISQVWPLPPYNTDGIVAAANGWGIGRGFSTTKADVHRFTGPKGAEKFRRGKRLLNLNLTADTLRKYLCAASVR